MYDLNTALANAKFTYLRIAAEADAEAEGLTRKRDGHLASFTPEMAAGADEVRYTYGRRIEKAEAKSRVFKAKAEVAGRGYLLVTGNEAIVAGWQEGDLLNQAIAANRVIYGRADSVELTVNSNSGAA